MKLTPYLALLTAGSASVVLAQSSDPVLPTETAARETLRLSSERESLRVAGLDLFPHAAGTAVYDDNILISSGRELDDVIWRIAPGLTIAAGDVSAYLPGAVTVEQLRRLLYYSLVDDVSKPRRFLALDYTPNFEIYTEYDEYNFIGQSARLSGGYALTRLALGLDFDYDRLQLKNNSAGALTETSRYDARLRTRYDFTDRTSLEVNGEYYKAEYEEGDYQGYDEVSNENWLNRQFADRLNLGVGLGFGFVFPEDSPDQTYEQALLRGVYRLTGKLFFSSAVGMEFRQYDSDKSDTTHPVFSVMTVYQPRETTTVTLEGHRRDQPSPYGGYNYTTLGASIGVRQLVFNRVYAAASLGYDNLEYRETENRFETSRSDDYFNGRVGLEYQFNRHLTGSLFYTHFRDDSSEAAFRYDNNVVGVQVAWRW